MTTDNIFDKDACENCEKCTLASTRQNVVIDRVNKQSKWIIVSDYPTQTDDNIGCSLLGDNGKMLEIAFQAVGLNTKDFYITSLVKCKPLTNEIPTTLEEHTCYYWLYQQILQLQAQVIITLGNIPLKYLYNSSAAISKLQGIRLDTTLPLPKELVEITEIKGKKKRGKTTTEELYTIFPLYHPSALLRSHTMEIGGVKWQTWKSIIKLKELLDNYEPCPF
jgi:DNA polymerase